MLAGKATDVVLDPNSGTVFNPDTDTEVQGNLQVVYAGIAASTGTPPRPGRLHEPQPGPGLEPDDRRHRQPADRQRHSTAHERQPGHEPHPQRRRRADRPEPCPPSHRQRRPETRSTRVGSTPPSPPRRRLRRALRDQGLRPELDPGRIPTLPILATPYQPAIPTNDVTQPDYPIDIQQSGQSTTSPWPSIPTNPNVVYLGGFGGDDYPRTPD